MIRKRGALFSRRLTGIAGLASTLGSVLFMSGALRGEDIAWDGAYDPAVVTADYAVANGSDNRVQPASVEVVRQDDYRQQDYSDPADFNQPPDVAVSALAETSGDPASEELFTDEGLSLTGLFHRLSDPSACPPAVPAGTFPDIKLTGFFQADAAFFAQDSTNQALFGDIQDFADFRRARLASVGKVAPNVAYSIEMDFAFPGRPSFMDVWTEIQNTALGNIRIGQFRQPLSMEALTSVRELPFLERSPGFSAFVPFRQIGVQAADTALDDSVTWAGAFYRYRTDVFGSVVGDGGYGMSYRLTALPIFEEEDNILLHVGGGYSYNDPNNNSLRFASTPEIGFTNGDFNGAPLVVPFFVNTGVLPVQNTNLLNAELAGSWGAFMFQSEVLYAIVDTGAGSVTFPSAYAMATYCLTGERHKYNKKNAVFGRIVPDHNLGPGGWGAWEVAGRYSYIDLNNGGIQGGRLSDLTFGINWYWNARTKMQFNYIRAFQTDAIAGDNNADIVAMRTQLDF